MKVAMNRKTLIIILIAGIVTLFSLAFAAASFFYFKSKTIAPVCPNDGLQAETDAALEALEECLSEASAPQAVAVATSSVDDSHWFDLCQNTFKDFASLQVGDCLADSAVDSVKNQSMAGLIIVRRFLLLVPRLWPISKVSIPATRKMILMVILPARSVLCQIMIPIFQGWRAIRGIKFFCFSDKEKAEQVFCSSGDTGRATVWVKKYKYTYFEDSESLNEAVEWSGQTNKQLDGVKIGSKMSGMTVLGSLDQDSRKR
jgi:hypothetical protein